MIIAVDVHYRGSAAKAVSIEFNDWEDEIPHRINTVEINIFAEYASGEFYKRELPGIMKVLRKSDLNQVEAILVDGYVILNDEGKPGLGGYLFHELNKKIPVIGIAKNPYRNNKKKVREVYRGFSKRPLFVSCLGMGLEEAAEKVSRLRGNFRIPTLLKWVDRETKK